MGRIRSVGKRMIEESTNRALDGFVASVTIEPSLFARVANALLM